MIQTKKVFKFLLYNLIFLVIIHLFIKYFFHYFVHVDSLQNTSELVEMSRIKYSIPLIATIIIIIFIIIVNRTKKIGLSFFHLFAIGIIFWQLISYW